MEISVHQKIIPKLTRPNQMSSGNITALLNTYSMKLVPQARLSSKYGRISTYCRSLLATEAGRGDIGECARSILLLLLLGTAGAEVVGMGTASEGLMTAGRIVSVLPGD